MLNQGSFSARMLLVLVLLIGFIASIQTVHRVHAAGTLSIDPPSIEPVPSETPVRVDVRVDAMDSFNSWDIAVSTNAKALNGTSIDVSSQNAFPSGTIVQTLVNCVNDVGSNCVSGIDRVGVVHDEGFIFGSSIPASLTGVLFSINFIAGSSNFTNLDFVTYSLCYCANPQNPITVQHDTIPSVYGTPPSPDFRLTLLDQSLTVHQGSSVSTTVQVTSVNAFSGQVNFTYTADAAGISVTFRPDNAKLNNSTATATMDITTTPTSLIPGSYQLNVTATSNTTLPHYALLALHVQRTPGFTIGASPSQLNLPQASSGTSTITLTGDTGFSGDITLNILSATLHDVTPHSALNATATLGLTSLHLSSSSTNSTTILISIPPSFYAYNYQIIINATSGALSKQLQVTVQPPPFDLVGSVSPSALTISAARSSSATVSVTGANYFIGSVYVSSTFSGGTARFNQTTRFMAIGQSLAFSVNITIDPSLTPGNYTLTLTVYSGTGIAHVIQEPLNVTPPPQHSSTVSLPTILGLSSPAYFGILGVFTLIFVVLSVVVFRNSRKDRDEYWAEQ